MNLCIVVHHRSDHHQPWINSWMDDDYPEAIQTTIKIGQLCSKEKDQNKKVFVHRCGWGQTEPTVCCEVDVERVDPIDKKTCLVSFHNPKVINHEPVKTPIRGQNYYFE